MRSIILSAARRGLFFFLAYGLVNLPILAANEKPLGMVVTADHAKLDNAKALSGADVYSGDALATEPDGSLRMKIGSSQVYLLASSSATLMPREGKVQARIDHGTVGFSTLAPSQIEIETPLGVITGANGQRVFGQVSILSPDSIRVTAFEGALLVETANGAEKTIDQGQTYDATLETADGGQTPAGAGAGGGGQAPAGGGAPIGVGGPGINWKHVVDVAIPTTILGVTALVIWLEESESCTTPNCN